MNYQMDGLGILYYAMRHMILIVEQPTYETNVVPPVTPAAAATTRVTINPGVQYQDVYQLVNVNSIFWKNPLMIGLQIE